MKKLLFLLVILLVGTACAYAQTLSAADMLEMVNCKNYDCFGDKAKAKEYEIGSNNETEGYKTYAYYTKAIYKNESNENVAKPYAAIYNLYMEDKQIGVAHTVGTKAERDELLAQFKADGYSYQRATRKKVSAENTAQEYTSPNHPGIVLFMTTYALKEGKQDYTMYEFELMKPLK